MKLPSPINDASQDRLPTVTAKKPAIWSRARQAAKRARREIELYRMILKHPDTPLLAKGLFAGAVLYAFSPIDLIPDFLPAVGWLDDLVVVPTLAWLALELVPNEVIEECRTKLKAGNPPPGTV